MKEPLEKINLEAHLSKKHIPKGLTEDPLGAYKLSNEN